MEKHDNVKRVPSDLSRETMDVLQSHGSDEEAGRAETADHT